jgi:predicted nuclease of restriction endonuclease-like RecB superfamily
LAKHWQIEASVKYKKRDYLLLLSENDCLKSHYREWGEYRPEEFQEFLNAYNKSSSPWQAQWCDELVELGGQQFCFPDLSFIHGSNGKKVHLELFHKWHRGELEKRIKTLQKSEKSQVIIGICNSLVKQANMGFPSIHEEEFENFGFIFRGVPTPKAVSSLLNKAYGE